MCICAPFKRLPLKCRASTLYFFPLFYCCFLVGSLALLPSPFVNRPLFSSCCLAFAFLNLLTSVVGQVGIFKRMDAALRGTLVLLMMENLMIFFIGVFLLVHLFSIRPAALFSTDKLAASVRTELMEGSGAFQQDHAFDDDDDVLHPTSRLTGECLLKFSVETRWWVATVASGALVVCSTITSLCLRAVAEFQAELDAEAFVEDARHLRDSERMLLLQASKEYGPEHRASFLRGSDSFRQCRESASREGSPRGESGEERSIPHKLAQESMQLPHEQTLPSSRKASTSPGRQCAGDDGADPSTPSGLHEDAHQIETVDEEEGRV
ncbi:hypothetical protein TGGT1_285290 [Toxoplasma gondii GT1]|uniref:Transmembrane protein n=7 Tax=Toxoplasma gondii TaxID=5811 RepID=S7UMX8_TOXGG|nr:hypothetical protein TGGT1_285290 [Toxoplasma gondii GT1]KAF4643898.1 hypothetical protein TGRH88_026540 [Toxoplasma gondii]KFG54701.1 putative transmembrane protein [Toxoplasma gondii FOU]KYF43905.1 hypothetical protein TGARI_285290 [Toxoplasma gondii ARI]PIM00292.1 putative transmembrane protein [Toxoplasma gondii COUG]PUA87969.1 putative transmembrane protein [Toxoplasma gondii TgCATBr9]RQX69852.1 putative transmembrane protein [Toxoplasma gondii CAST]